MKNSKQISNDLFDMWNYKLTAKLASIIDNCEEPCEAMFSVICGITIHSTLSLSEMLGVIEDVKNHLLETYDDRKEGGEEGEK